VRKKRRPQAALPDFLYDHLAKPAEIDYNTKLKTINPGGISAPPFTGGKNYGIGYALF